MRDTREPNKLHRYSPRLVPNAKTGRNDFEGMASFPDGKYVLFADYDQLRRQIAEADAKAATLERAAGILADAAERDRAKLALAEQLLREVLNTIESTPEGIALDSRIVAYLADAAIAAGKGKS